MTDLHPHQHPHDHSHDHSRLQSRVGRALCLRHDPGDYRPALDANEVRCWLGEHAEVAHATIEIHHVEWAAQFDAAIRADPALIPR
jgi:hypothetical protein